MLPLLFDEGLPDAVASALSALELEADAVGLPGAPPRGSLDEINCAWCQEHGAVLVTNDRGRKDRAILDALATQHVHAIFVHQDLQSAPSHHLARALLKSEDQMDTIARRHLLRHRLRIGGGLEKR